MLIPRPVFSSHGGIHVCASGKRPYSLPPTPARASCLQHTVPQTSLINVTPSHLYGAHFGNNAKKYGNQNPEKQGSFLRGRHLSRTERMAYYYLKNNVISGDIMSDIVCI